MHRILLAVLLISSVSCWSQNTFMKTVGTVNSDYGTACIPTNDYGSLILTGGGTTTGAGVQFGIVKTSYDGSLEWSQVYQFGNFSIAYDVVANANGYCVTGSTGGSFNSQELFLMQIDESGNELWKYHYDISANDNPVQLIECKNGDLLSLSIGNYNTGGYSSAQLIRFDSQGNVLWSRHYSGFNGLLPRAVVEMSNGDFTFVSNVRLSSQTYPEHSIVIRTDATGIPIWTKVFYSNYLEEPRDMVVNANDELFIVGQTYFIENEWDGFLLKLNGEGELLFDNFYDAGTSQGEIFRRVALDNSGGVLLIGDLGGFGERNITLLRVSEASGTIDWSYQYPVSPQFTNYPADMYVSFNDGIVFTGDVRPPTYYRDAALFRTNSEGQIDCYTNPVNYAINATVFTSLDETISSIESSTIPRTTFAFTYPTDVITEKTICENPGPLAFVTSEVVDDCPAVCLDFYADNLGDPTNWNWEFEGASPEQATGENPNNICYDAPGTYKVSLTVTNAEGSSTIDSWVEVPGIDCPVTEIPNVFTPNGDNVNDEFKFDGLSGNFEFSILNRWGNVVFETSKPNVFWSGTDKKGNPLSEGVYFYRLEKDGIIKHGFIHLVR